MKVLCGILCMVVVMNLVVRAQNIDNPPIQVECVTNWCEVVRGPSGTITYTNIYVWPSTNVCLGTEICGWPEMDWQCDTNVVTRWRWAPETTNCPPQLYTNTVCPYFLTNWWVVSSPGYSGSGEGSGVCFYPTNCGEGTITFHGVWRNSHPCTGEPIGGGTISRSIGFKVVHVDIAEDEKKVCACDSASFTLTNSCGEAVTWEVLTNGVPGEPTVSGNSIIAGTNCGTWTVIARSTNNAGCADSASLHVFGVADLTVALPRAGTNEPPTYITCPRATNAVDRWLRVTATSCPWVSEEQSCTNLPACWQITGGHRPVMVTNDCVNRLAVEVDLAQRGTHTVTARAGCSSKTVVIIVQDTNAPTLSCSDVTVDTDAGKCYATVYLTNYISANDDCGWVTITFSDDGPRFNVGTNSVTATATDMAGNTTNCTFKVIVKDREAPLIVCPTNIVRCADPSGTNIVTWPAPTASDNCAVTNVSCYPPSGYNFPVGETTVTCTATDSSGNQGYCTFIVTVAKVDVTNIKFNHNPNSSASDAINLRQDYNTTYDISNGEWIQGGANLPACYVANRPVTIQVRLTVHPDRITNAEVWAVSTDSDGSLGDVVKRSVAFSGGISTPEYVTFSVSGSTPATIKKTTTDVWQWKMENINGSGSAGCNANSSGPHTIYTILAEPVAPWDNAAGDQRNAWSRALDLICAGTPWAGGATSIEEAATRVVEAINGSGRFRYDIYRGAPHYLDLYSGVVEFSKCLERLENGNGLGELVNCTDCASFVTTFVNLIGGSLYSSRMERNFDTNPYCAIGRTPWTAPAWGWGFSFHEVGWAGACGDSHKIFDACLKVDGDGDPSVPPRSERTPANIIFSDGDPGLPYVYRESLASPGVEGYDNCVAVPQTRVRRTIR